MTSKPQATSTATPSPATSPSPAPAAPASNAAIAAAFDEIADLLELQQANPFRVRAYRNAARTTLAWPEPLANLLARHQDLDALPGIGRDLAGKIEEIASTGSCAVLQRLRDNFPAGITALLQVPGMGPKRVHTVFHELGLQSPDQLLQAAQAGRLRGLHGFGKLSEERIAKAAADHLQRNQRWPIARVEDQVSALLAHLRQTPGVRDIVAAGSFRRRRDTVGDIDLLAAASAGQPLATSLAAFPSVRQVLAQGPTRASVVLGNGLQVDLRVVAPESFGAALVYFTGAKAHNIALRRIAQAQGLKINEYGVYRTGPRSAERIAGATEASVYAAVGLPLIAPELREDQGEFDAARRDALPRLVTLADLRGDLHAHTRASDGTASLEQMALAAKALGLRYLAITDHSQRLKMVHGLDAQRLAEQGEAIDQLNARLQGITLLKGIEVDILEDGSLDLPDAVLGTLDLVVGAAHSALGLPRARQTERLLRAMDHRHFSILAHPNGRLLGTRGPCEVDMERVIAHASQRGCFLELNAQPERLDLFDQQCRQARDAGVLVAISSDAHGTQDFHWLRLGVDQARRGWLESAQVLNALPLAQLRKKLKATMG